MAALKEKSYYYSIIGKNPHMRSLTVDEFSKIIHAEEHVRPHMMAALKVKMGSTGSPGRHMSPTSTQNEASEMQISPQKVATLLNLAKRSTGSPSKVKVQIATNPHIYKNWGKKPTKYAYALKCKRDKKP